MREPVEDGMLSKTTRFPVTKAEIDGFALGDEVKVTISGKITELTGPRSRPSYSDSTTGGKKKKEQIPPYVEIKQTDVVVEKVGEGSIEELAEDY